MLDISFNKKARSYKFSRIHNNPDVPSNNPPGVTISQQVPIRSFHPRMPIKVRYQSISVPAYYSIHNKKNLQLTAIKVIFV